MDQAVTKASAEQMSDLPFLLQRAIIQHQLTDVPGGWELHEKPESSTVIVRGLQRGYDSPETMAAWDEYYADCREEVGDPDYEYIPPQTMILQALGVSHSGVTPDGARCICLDTEIDDENHEDLALLSEAVIYDHLRQRTYSVHLTALEPDITGNDYNDREMAITVYAGDCFDALSQQLLARVSPGLLNQHPAGSTPDASRGHAQDVPSWRSPEAGR